MADAEVKVQSSEHDEFANLGFVTVPGAKSTVATEPSSIPFDPTLLIAISIFIRPDQ